VDRSDVNSGNGSILLSTTPAGQDEVFADSIPELTRRIERFAIERDWEKYHRPRNLMLALLGELGELAELFQFRSDYDCGGSTTASTISLETLDKTGQELADVTIYLLRLADVCGVRLNASLQWKGVNDEEER